MNIFSKSETETLKFHCSHFNIKNKSYRYLGGACNEYVLQIQELVIDNRFSVSFWKNGVKQWTRNTDSQLEVITLLVQSGYEDAVGAERKFMLDNILESI